MWWPPVPVHASTPYGRFLERAIVSAPAPLQQLELSAATGHAGPSAGHTIEQDFWTFHAANPHVYRRLVVLARELVGRGHTKLGIGMLFEVLRWQSMLATALDHTGLLLNNSYRSYYAREIMRREPDLDGAFETRRLRIDPPTNQGGTHG